jgi:hypothetical protein
MKVDSSICGEKMMLTENNIRPSRSDMVGVAATFSRQLHGD